MQKTVLSSEYLSSYGSLKILGQLLGGGTLVGGGGRGCEISPHCPHSRPPTPLLSLSTITFPQYSFTHHLHHHHTLLQQYYTKLTAFRLYKSTLPYFIECVLEPDKHRAKGGVLGLAGCALLIGVLIEGITNTYWVQIPSATLPTICPEP